jgi:hypothetical protein
MTKYQHLTVKHERLGPHPHPGPVTAWLDDALGAAGSGFQAMGEP